MVDLPLPVFLYGTYDCSMKISVLWLECHEKNDVGCGKCLNNGTGCCLLQIVEHALNKTKALFANKVLVY
jgi:hypothetical protein